MRTSVGARARAKGRTSHEKPPWDELREGKYGQVDIRGHDRGRGSVEFRVDRPVSLTLFCGAGEERRGCSAEEPPRARTFSLPSPSRPSPPRPAPPHVRPAPHHTSHVPAPFEKPFPPCACHRQEERARPAAARRPARAPAREGEKKKRKEEIGRPTARDERRERRRPLRPRSARELSLITSRAFRLRGRELRSAAMPRGPEENGAAGTGGGRAKHGPGGTAAAQAADVREKKRKAADAPQEAADAASASARGTQEEAAAYPAKRGRGRPRKDGQPPKQTAAVDGIKTAAARGRGRPRKEDQEAAPSEKAKEPGAIRGRGRPRKGALHGEGEDPLKKAEAQELNKAKEAAAAASKRGRPANDS
ncbi:MAG: hypothetical protein BJ554DRAFT_1941 [Olpidium bornovanus]|uniref:Uncharacterized protein n=1 Tax=Olpidium bornovanus TaxID=278681 RepID=A0A8H7ZRK7_9FUNG|nr:MAG: hypothetical protein BJ554DRAFT_1941 [Olpidium bornovanus]